MKNYFNISSLLISLFLFSSCELFSGKATPDEQGDTKVEVQKVEVLPDSIKKKMTEQDSLVLNLIAKIETLKLELDSAKNKVSGLQSEVDGLKSPTNLFTIIAFVVGILAILLSMFKSKGLKKLDIENIFKDCLDQSTRLKAMRNQLDLLQSSSRVSGSRVNQTYSSNNNLDTRVASLEVKMKQLVDVINARFNSPAPSRDSENAKPKVDNNSMMRTGYAKLNSQNYFIDIFDSNQEGCVYKIKFKSSTKGEFDLISLNKIKSRNGWQEVIEYEGPCTMAEATSYKLVNPGIIEKYDSKTWEVKQKLIIKIFK